MSRAKERPVDRVVVEDLGIRYKVHREKSKHLRTTVLSALRGRGGYDYLWALDGVSFSLQDGDVLAVIGRNGAGKSTLCLALSGIIQPDRGRVEVRGWISTLLALGAGFIKNLSGRDNIYLNGALLGLSKVEIDEKFDEIVDFAELEEFIDVPIRQYSSGMLARLGFSVAVSVTPEILIIDEVLGVGDEAFRRKCQERMKELMESSKAIIIVTHNSEFAKALCNKALWLKRGKVKEYGDVEPVVGGYQEYLERTARRRAKERVASIPDAAVDGS